MNNFRPVSNGIISNIDVDTLKDANSYFKSFIRSGDDYDYLTDPEAIKAVIGRFKVLMGRSFTEFMFINYENGIGKRAEIVRNISHFLNGRISAKALIAQIKMEEHRCESMFRAKKSYDITVNTSVRGEDPNKIKTGITEKSLYHVLTSVGPVLFCRLMLTFSGEVYDGNN